MHMQNFTSQYWGAYMKISAKIKPLMNMHQVFGSDHVSPLKLGSILKLVHAGVKGHTEICRLIKIKSAMIRGLNGNKR